MESSALDELKQIKKSLHHISVIIFLGFLLFIELISHKIYEQVEIKKQEVVESVPSSVDVQITDAKNTTYQNGLISVIVASIDPSATWEFFPSDNGRAVVEVNGKFPTANATEVLEILSDELLLRTDDKLAGKLQNDDTGKWDAKNVGFISFKMQFVKDYEHEHKTAYNRYVLSYSEIVILLNDDTALTLPTSTKMPAVLDDYIRKCIWKTT
jgi:hypothetical protein